MYFLLLLFHLLVYFSAFWPKANVGFPRGIDGQPKLIMVQANVYSGALFFLVHAAPGAHFDSSSTVQIDKIACGDAGSLESFSSD